MTIELRHPTKDKLDTSPASEAFLNAYPKSMMRIFAETMIGLDKAGLMKVPANGEPPVTPQIVITAIMMGMIDIVTLNGALPTDTGVILIKTQLDHFFETARFGTGETFGEAKLKGTKTVAEMIAEAVLKQASDTETKH